MIFQKSFENTNINGDNRERKEKNLTGGSYSEKRKEKKRDKNKDNQTRKGDKVLIYQK